MGGTRVYNSWIKMIDRCTNPRCKCFHNYGGRGIKVCSRWFDFREFYKDMGDPPEGCTIERIETEGHYEPSNCCWASVKAQNNNRRSNLKLELKGVVKTAAQWSEELGINPFTLYNRKRRGWTDERALTQPVKPVRAYLSSPSSSVLPADRS